MVGKRQPVTNQRKYLRLKPKKSVHVVPHHYSTVIFLTSNDFCDTENINHGNISISSEGKTNLILTIFKMRYTHWSSP